MLADMLTIGTFSRATHLSVRTLRRYHEQGLLVPAEIDAVTGYRCYRREQIMDAQLIHRLREVDLPLRAVGQIVKARDPEVTARLLDEHRGSLQLRRADLDRMVAGVADLLAGAPPLQLGAVLVRGQRAEPILLLSGHTTEQDFRGFFGRAFARLGVFADRHRLTVSGPGGARFPDPQWDPDDVQVQAFLPVRSPLPRGPGPDGAVLGSPEAAAPAGPSGPAVRRAVLPAGQLAAVLHAGDYDGIIDAHAALGEWAAANGVEPAGSLQERYLVSPADDADPAAWRTEVGWLLHPQSGEDSS